MEFTNYSNNKFLDCFFRGVKIAIPNVWHLCLYVSSPEKDDSGIEVSTEDWINYSRLPIPRIESFWCTPSGGIRNNMTISFGKAEIRNHIRLTHFGFKDDEGILWFYEAIETPFTVMDGDEVEFDESDLLLNFFRSNSYLFG